MPGGRLIITCRPGMAAVTGTVKAVKENNATYDVTIENSVPMPVSGGTRIARVKASFSKGKVEKMKLKPGSRVVAVIRDHPGLQVISEGGECADAEFPAEGYNIRYSGEFGFRNDGRHREKHVIAGTITSKRAGRTKTGTDWSCYEVSYRSSNMNKCKRVMAYNKPPFEEGQKVVFLTGEMKVDRYDGKETCTAEDIISMQA